MAILRAIGAAKIRKRIARRGRASGAEQRDEDLMQRCAGGSEPACDAAAARGGCTAQARRSEFASSGWRGVSSLSTIHDVDMRC